MNDFNAIKKCRYGTMIYNKRDTYIGKSLDMYGEFSEGEATLFRQIVGPGDIVVEVGANIGCHTVMLSELVGETGKIFAFEPQRLVFQMLAGNMAVNSLTNVHCYQKAVGATTGSLVVPVLDYNQEVNWGGLELGTWETGEKVDLVTIDDQHLPNCQFIKVDVEGMEIKVLQGAQQTIEKYKPVLYVENDRQDQSHELIRYIDSLDYTMYWHCPYLYNRDNYFANQENVFQQVVSVNMLCIPNHLTPKLVDFEKVEVR